jgi:hypothetical protein
LTLLFYVFEKALVAACGKSPFSFGKAQKRA